MRSLEREISSLKNKLGNYTVKKNKGCKSFYSYKSANRRIIKSNLKKVISNINKDISEYGITVPSVNITELNEVSNEVKIVEKFKIKRKSM